MKEPKMTGPEMIAEATWLLDAGVHPLMVAQVLGKKMPSLARLFNRYGDPSLALAFDRTYKVAA